MKKKILLSSYMHGNMEALIDYYEKKLKSLYCDEVELIFLDMFKIDKMKKFKRYFNKFLQKFKKYDMIITDYASPILNTGKKVIFMDHGYGLKSMPGLDEIKNPQTIKIGKLVREKSDYVITLSERDSEYFYRLRELEEFRMPEYLPLGQPRNDLLFDEHFIKNAKRDLSEKFNLQDEKVVLYAPTWRGYDFSKDLPFNRDTLEKLNDYLKKVNWKFFYRPHYIENTITEELVKGLDNFVKIDVNVEPHTQKILAAVDMVITDYSSIIVDYLIMDKPIVFMPFDKERYNDFRGLVVDFDNVVHTPGPKINDLFEITHYITALEKGEDNYREYREKAKEYYYSYFDCNSCERIWELIVQCLNI